MYFRASETKQTMADQLGVAVTGSVPSGLFLRPFVEVVTIAFDHESRRWHPSTDWGPYYEISTPRRDIETMSSYLNLALYYQGEAVRADLVKMLT